MFLKHSKQETLINSLDIYNEGQGNACNIIQSYLNLHYCSTFTDHTVIFFSNDNSREITNCTVMISKLYCNDHYSSLHFHEIFDREHILCMRSLELICCCSGGG